MVPNVIDKVVVQVGIYGLLTPESHTTSDGNLSDFSVLRCDNVAVGNDEVWAEPVVATLNIGVVQVNISVAPDRDGGSLE